jgi:hypothetical protein
MNFDFDQELSRALERKEPAERVVSGAGHRRPWARQQRAAAALALAASLMVGVFGIVRYEEHRKGERAKDELMTALRITAKTLDTVERKLND